MTHHYRKYLLYFIWLCIPAVLISCGGDNAPDSLYEGVFERAYKLSKSGQKEESVRIVDSVFAMHPNASPFSRYKRYYLKKQFYFYDRQKFDSAALYVDSMLYELNKGKTAKQHPLEYALALNSKGDYFYDANDLDKAFEYYYKSRMAAPDTCVYANQTYHLGMVTYRQQRYNDAVGYFLQSLRENQSCGGDSISFYRIQELMNNIALSYTQLKRDDSAHYYYRKALDYIATGSANGGAVVKKFSEKATGVIYGNVAKLYMRALQFDTAEQLLNRSIAINKRPGYDRNDAMLAEMQLAELYSKTGRLSQSLPLMESVKVTLDSFPNANTDLRRKYMMYQYSNAAGQRDEAFKYLQEYTKLKDSLEVSETRFNQTNVSQFLRNVETEYRLKLLTKDNELNRVYLGITVGLVILTIVVIVLVFMSYKRTRENVQKLTLLNFKVNERKDQLEYALDELKKLNTDKDRILYVVAHDLKNPISGIMALTHVILEDSDEMDESQRKSLEIINGASENSLKLIGKLLEIGVDSGEQSVKPTDVAELKSIADDVAALLKYEADNKKIKLVCSFPEGPVYVNGVKDRLWRVISNILSNAIKFSPEGKSVELSIQKTRTAARVAIADQGIGIPEEMQPVVFNMFSSAKRLGTAGEASFGLGLSITKRIIETHKGKVWFETRPREGTTFFFEIPLAQQ